MMSLPLPYSQPFFPLAFYSGAGHSLYLAYTHHSALTIPGRDASPQGILAPGTVVTQCPGPYPACGGYGSPQVDQVGNHESGEIRKD